LLSKQWGKNIIRETKLTNQLFNFDSEFKLGIAEIDDEHASLVNMLNDVHNLIRSDKKDEARAYFRNTLAAYVGEHFSHEEKFMEKMAFPQLEEHKKIHNNFKRSMEESLLLIDSLDEAAFRNALSDTYTWIINHIGKTDRKYAAFFQPVK
jgi:hemerythrin